MIALEVTAKNKKEISVRYRCDCGNVLVDEIWYSIKVYDFQERFRCFQCGFNTGSKTSGDGPV